MKAVKYFIYFYGMYRRGACNRSKRATKGSDEIRTVEFFS